MKEQLDSVSIEQALERLLGSSGFRRAERLRALLRSLVERARLAPDEPVKEYELGVDVFRRPVAYDPRIDPIVRVGMRELRMKLAAYYAAEGVADPIRIEIPRGSYRAVIARAESSVAVRPAEPLEVQGIAKVDVAPWRRSRAWVGAVALLLLMTAWPGGDLDTDRDDADAPLTVRPATSVAVLPFVNLDGDSRHEYISDGITEEIMTALMRIDGLLVTGRTSSFSFKGQDVRLDEVGRTLGVTAILSGSVRIIDERVRVLTRLTSVPQGFLLWSRTFESSLHDPVSNQPQLAAAVASALNMRLDPGSGQAFVRRSNDDPRAYDLYRQARALAETRVPASLRQSITLFEEAAAIDPGYALAYAGLADANGTLAFNGQTEAGSRLASARAAAQRALALDPTLGEALADLAHLTAFVDWDWTRANRMFRQAAVLTPSNPRIRAWFGQTLAVQGRFDEAVAELRVAERLDPLATSVTYSLGEVYLYAGRYAEALLQARRLLELNPDSWGGHNLAARAAMAAGRPSDAIVPLLQCRGELWADTLAFVAAGDRLGARATLGQRGSAIAATQPFTIASLYASAGDRDQALSWLERAYAERQVDVVSLAVDPALSYLHRDARFLSLVRRIGLPNGWSRSD